MNQASLFAAAVLGSVADVERTPYLGWLSGGVHCLIVYLNTVVAESETLVGLQLVVSVITLFWFWNARLRLSSAIFASVALLPATVFGVGYFMLPGMVFTLDDLFSVIVFGLWLLRPFITLFWLLGMCTLGCG